MKLSNIFKLLSAGIVLYSVVSCHNQEAVFPDYDGGVTAYFAYQYPVRTIVLGESETFDTSLDNQHKCIIYGTMGGAYKGKDIVIDVEVDNTLVDNLYFRDGSPVQYMPTDYYELSGNQLEYNGTYMGGVEVTLKDAFFEDPDAIKNTYVVPVKMTNIVKGADQILTGTPVVAGEPAVRTDPNQWSVLPMDYTLYCIKYINQWDGSWLRRGEDQITDAVNGNREEVRHEQYVENDEVVFLTTNSLDAVTLPVSTNVVTNVTYVPVNMGYALYMTNKELKDANWGAQVWYELDEPMQSGKTYTFKCVAKATEQKDWVSVFLQSSDGSAQNYNHGMGFTTEWKETTMTITPDADVYTKLTFNFGDMEGTLMLDDVSLYEDGSDVNLIANGDFENGLTTGWASYQNYQSIGVGSALIEVKDVESRTCDVLLTFDENGECNISSATPGFTASGTGKYIKDGEKLAWGNKDRDGIYLEYTVDFGDVQIATRDTLVSRSREVTMEKYTPTYRK